ncbi:hypothetical protein FXO37_13125 [Capsicum annuum]|nr:hypothetical protein FXO37_13125 [Capsicum annuum]
MFSLRKVLPLRKGLTKTSSLTKFQKSVKRKKSDEKEECSKIASPVASDPESEQKKVVKVCDNDEDALKFANLYFIHAFLLSSVDTVAIPRLHFDLVEIGRYSDYPWGSVAFEELVRSLHKKLKPKGKFYMLLGMPLAIQIWLYECCSKVPHNVASKVDSQIPRILNWKTNSPRSRYETLMGSMFDDTYDKDPPQRQNQFTTKKKHHGDFLASPVKKKMKPHPKGVDELISKRTHPLCAAKIPFFRTLIHKPIQTKVTLRENRKDINRPNSKKSIPVQSPALSSFSSEDEDGVVSKKVFDKFCEKKQAKGSEFDQPPADKNVKSTSPHQATTKFVHEFNKSPEGTLITKSVDESIGEAQISESQLTFSDDVLRSINLDSITKANVEVEDEFKANQAQQTAMHVSRIRRSSRYNESPFTMKFGSTDDKNWFYVMGTPGQTWSDEQIDVCLYYLRKKSKYDPNISYKFNTVVCNFMNIVTTVFDVYKLDDATLNAGGKKYHLNEYVSGFCMHATVPWHTVDHMFISVHVKTKHHWVFAVISFNHWCIYIYIYDSLSAAGHDAAVLTEIEKLAKVIPICLIECKFYENKDIDIDYHPNYKLNDKMDPFGVSIVENVPQQPSGSLDCGLYMVTYAECLTFGEAVPCIDFDPDLIRIRYASLLWDYGTRKANAKAQSDDEAPMRPLRITELTEGTEVIDI